MAGKRKIEVFSAGCATCHDAIEVIRRAACPSCEVIVHDMRDGEVAKRAKGLGIRSVAGERLPVLLRLQRLWATPQAEARGLLRVLFVRLGAVPARSSGTIALLNR